MTQIVSVLYTVESEACRAASRADLALQIPPADTSFARLVRENAVSPEVPDEPEPDQVVCREAQ